MLLLTDPVTEGLFSLGTGVIGGIASLFGADSQSKNVKRTNEMNYKIAQEANANQLQIARENNQLQLDAMRENNAFNKQSAIDMFNMEAAYNSPEAQKERLLAAGINPATLYGQGGSVGGSANASTPSAASSGVSPSMPSYSVPTMQTPPSVLNTMFGNIESLTRSLGNVARSGLDAANQNRVKTLLQAELDKMVADKEYIQASTAYTNVDKQLKQLELQVGKRTAMRKAIEEIRKLHNEAAVAKYKGETEKAQKLFIEAETKLSNQKHGFNELYNPELIKNIQEERELIIQKQETEKTNQKANIASANASNASADLSRKQARIAELEGDAQEVLNEFLPEQTILDMSMKDLDIIDKIFSAGRANNVPNLLDKLIGAGVREDIAKAVNDAMDRRKKYLERYHKYLNK